MKPVTISLNDLLPRCTTCNNEKDHRHGDKFFRAKLKDKELARKIAHDHIKWRTCDHIAIIGTCSHCGLFYKNAKHEKKSFDDDLIEDLDNYHFQEAFECSYCPKCGVSLQHLCKSCGAFGNESHSAGCNSIYQIPRIS